MTRRAAAFGLCAALTLGLLAVPQPPDPDRSADVVTVVTGRWASAAPEVRPSAPVLPQQAAQEEGDGDPPAAPKLYPYRTGDSPPSVWSMPAEFSPED